METKLAKLLRHPKLNISEDVAVAIEQRKAPLTINYVAALSNIDDATSMQCILTTIKDKSKLEGLGPKLKMVVEEYYGRNTIDEMVPVPSPSSGGSDLEESPEDTNGVVNNNSANNNANNIFNFFNNQQNTSETTKTEETNESNNLDQSTSTPKDEIIPNLLSPLDTINNFLPTVNLSNVFTPPVKEKKSKKDKKDKSSKNKNNDPTSTTVDATLSPPNNTVSSVTNSVENINEVISDKEKKEKKEKKKKISDTHLAKAADNTCQVPDCIIM